MSSTTTTPAEIEVPREFLPAFVSAATMALAASTEEVGGRFSGVGLSLDFSEEDRRSDDEKIAGVLERIAAREAILRALDDDEPVRVAVLQECVKVAVDDLRDKLHCATEGSNGVDFERVERIARLLRELTAWCDENGITTDEAVTA